MIKKNENKRINFFILNSLVINTKIDKKHSEQNVSLTYLRGLEVAELEEEDMPMV